MTDYPPANRLSAASHCPAQTSFRLLHPLTRIQRRKLVWILRTKPQPPPASSPPSRRPLRFEVPLPAATGRISPVLTSIRRASIVTLAFPSFFPMPPAPKPPNLPPIPPSLKPLSSRPN